MPGAVQAADESAGGNYADGTPRYVSCQTCHMGATTGVGATKAGTPTRTDLPLHDLTGGNSWMSSEDSGLTGRMTYTYVVTAWQDCNGNGNFDAGTDILREGKEF